jgi:hypothetical protein
MDSEVSCAAVVTTINEPNDAMKTLLKYAQESKSSLIVVGDKKTSTSWHKFEADFLSLEKQFAVYPELSQSIPVNHYARKNLGYLRAMEFDTEWIYETDDDNFPTESPFGLRKTNFLADTFESKSKWLNVYQIFGYESEDIKPSTVWPRGFDLRSLYFKSNFLFQEEIQSPIQQGLANGDPDVDAIYRLVVGKNITFHNRTPIGLLPKQICPINSQSTWWHASVYQMMYLPSTCTFRLTDILRGFVAWRILQERNESLSFHAPTVRQDRNEHDLLKDFAEELQLFIFADKLIEDLSALKIKDLSVSDQLLSCYSVLEANKVITSEEFGILEKWNSFFQNDVG